jgi:serine/threonine protein kinase
VEDLEGQEKAIKVIKLTDKFYEAGKIEAETLEKLNKADPEGKSFIVKLFDHFEFGEFYCLVFEKLGKSLFEVIKENGYKGLMYLGFKMNQIQEFARQILVSIEFMHGLGLTHTDLKPENVLLKDGELVWDEERVRDISRLFTLRIVR